MNLELISVISTDKLELPGLFYTPKTKSTKVAVWLHGMGDSGTFYNPVRINALAEALTARGISLLAFNNRGAHNIKKLRIVDETLADEDVGYSGGTFYELIADCVKDIDGSVSFLKNREFDELYLIGHSTGANKICAYHERAKNNSFKKYVLAGPGDDSGLFFSDLGEKKFKLALNFAKNARKANKYKIMPKYSGMYPFTVQSAVDILDPDGDYNTFPFYEVTTRRLGKKPLFSEYSKIDLPTLVIFGENDEYAYTAGSAKDALKIFKMFTNRAAAESTDFELVTNADHSFHGQENQFAEQIASWLAK